jgi:hypothetical protein
MAAIGHVQYAPGADEVTRFLSNHFVGADAERALDDLGPGAEKAVLKYHHFHPNGIDTTRDKARALLRRYKTKPVAILDQTVEDLGSADKGRVESSLEWLATSQSEEALTVAKADPAKRAAMATALNRAIDSPPSPFVKGNIISAAKRWGTAENGPSLVRTLTKEPFEKDGVAGALIEIRTQNSMMDEASRAKVVAALLDGLRGTGAISPDHATEPVVKALVAWATKDDGAAVAERLREMDKFFCPKSRAALFEWMGKTKPEKAIPILAASLADKDDYMNASKALQAMGPELGEKIEADVGQVRTNDRNQTAEVLKVLGAVGTKKSLDLLKKQQALYKSKNEAQLYSICTESIKAIEGRGK